MMGSLTLGFAATIALVLTNAFFVASEFALVKVRATRLQTLQAQGNRRAALASRISQNIDAYLSANQLGITLSSIALGWIGEPTFAHVLEPLFARLGSWATPAAHSTAVGVSFGLITVLHVVLGELAPKSIAIQRTEPVALWTAAPLHVFYVVAFPCIWLLNALSRLTLRAIGMGPSTEGEEVQTPEELRLILRHVRLDPGARRVMERLVDYTSRVVRHVMTLRSDLVVLYTGYVRRRLHRAPQVGDVVEAGAVRLVVLEVRQRNVTRLGGERHQAAPALERSTSVAERVPTPAPPPPRVH